MELGLIDVIERTLRVDGAWDDGVGRVLDYYLREGDVFVDVGANIGYFSLYASQIVGDDGLIVSIEPSIRALAKLASNVRLNHVSNICVVSVAAGTETGLSALRLSTENNIGASSLARTPDEPKTEPVFEVRLDSVLDHANRPPKLIKLDIEGGEFAALRGMAETLRRHRPAVICEWEEVLQRKAGVNAADIFAYMQGFGYTAFEIENTEALSARPLSMPDDLSPSCEILFTTSHPDFVST